MSRCPLFRCIALHADSVKITVIATGFQPENAPLPDRRASNGVVPVVKVQPRPPEPEPMYVKEPLPASEPEPEPTLIADSDPVLDLDDLDTGSTA